MSVARTQSEMDRREYAEWQAYYRIEPFGPHREDLQAGVVASVVANVNRRRGSKPFSPSDFVLDFEPRRKQTPEDMFRRLTQFSTMHNKRKQKG